MVPKSSTVTAAGQGHTPGPWGFGNTHSFERIILGQGGKGDYVCHVTVQQTGGGFIAQSMEGRREANARLIAAAPELLEALEALERNGHTQATWALAKAAIAKARGGAA